MVKESVILYLDIVKELSLFLLFVAFTIFVWANAPGFISAKSWLDFFIGCTEIFVLLLAFIAYCIHLCNLFKKLK